MTQLNRVLSFPGGGRADLAAQALGLEEEVARLRREAVAELLRPEAPGAKRRVLQLLKDAARLDSRARRLRAGES
jgi:malic enzyme